MKIGHSLFTIFEYSLRFSRALPFARVTEHVQILFHREYADSNLKASDMYCVLPISIIGWAFF